MYTDKKVIRINILIKCLSAMCYFSLPFFLEIFCVSFICMSSDFREYNDELVNEPNTF